MGWYSCFALVCFWSYLRMVLLWYGWPRVYYVDMIMTSLVCSLTMSYVDLCLYEAYVGDFDMTMMIMLMNMLYLLCLCLILTKHLICCYDFVRSFILITFVLTHIAYILTKCRVGVLSCYWRLGFKDLRKIECFGESS